MLQFLRLVAVALTALISACATLPEQPQVGPPGSALPPRASGVLAATESAFADRVGTHASGFRLLDTNEDGLRWRLALIDSAQHSLDLQYYVWWGDDSGDLLIKRVIAAADRGVRVRMVLDDLSTILEDGSHPKLRD
ncbi:MAG: phospholipase D family protein, partial [Burkholderiales bacterium]